MEGQPEVTEPEAVIELPEQAKRREIVFETDGTVVNLKRNELTALEVRGLVWMILNQLNIEITLK